MHLVCSLVLCTIGSYFFIMPLADPERIAFWEDPDQVGLPQETRTACEKEFIRNPENLADCTDQQLKDLAASIRKRKEGTKPHPNPSKAARGKIKSCYLEVPFRSEMKLS